MELTNFPRIVEVLYWDRCAALAVKKLRPAKCDPTEIPLNGVRNDGGEWEGMRAHGEHMQRYNANQKRKAYSKQLVDNRDSVLNQCGCIVIWLLSLMLKKRKKL